MKNTLLRAARRSQGWKQQQLADFTELSVSTIERAERGEPISGESMQRLCTCLQKTPEQLGLFHAITKITREDSAGEGIKTSDATQNIAASLERDHHTLLSDISLLQELHQPFNTVETAQRTILTLPRRVEIIQVVEDAIEDCATFFGVKLARATTLVQRWHGMASFCNELQYQIDQEIKKLDGIKTRYPVEEYQLSRRAFLTTLAALPLALLPSIQQSHKLVLALEEFLPPCAASLTACWHLSAGSHLETISPLIDAYLPTLTSICTYTSAYREIAADLLAQIYFLKAILAWHLEGLDRAEAYCTLARQYSSLTTNINLSLTALNQHALIAYYGKNFQKALIKSEEAETLLLHASHTQIYPIVRGRVFMYLAAIQAQQKMKNAEATLEQARTAFTTQADTDEPVPVYADCGEAPLLLWAGLTDYYLGSSNRKHARNAVASLSSFGHLQPSTGIPERFRLECLNGRIVAATQLNDLEEALVCFHAGKHGASILESKQRRKEIDYAYQSMLKQWPTEQRVKKLSNLRR